jgi:hypothetical protein
MTKSDEAKLVGEYRKAAGVSARTTVERLAQKYGASPDDVWAALEDSEFYQDVRKYKGQGRATG